MVTSPIIHSEIRDFQYFNDICPSPYFLLSFNSKENERKSLPSPSEQACLCDRPGLHFDPPSHPGILIVSLKTDCRDCDNETDLALVEAIKCQCQFPDQTLSRGQLMQNQGQTPQLFHYSDNHMKGGKQSCFDSGQTRVCDPNSIL